MIGRTRVCVQWMARHLLGRRRSSIGSYQCRDSCAARPVPLCHTMLRSRHVGCGEGWAGGPMRSARWLIAASRLSPVTRRQSMLSAACGLAVLTALAVVGCGGPAPARSADRAGSAAAAGNAGNAGNAGTGADASRPALDRAAASPDDEDDEQKIPPRGPIVVHAPQEPRGAARPG